MKLAQLIRVRRVHQVDLAQQVGVTQPTISRWVQEVAIPSLTNVPRLAKALRAEVDWKAFSKKKLRLTIGKSRAS